VTEDDVHDGYFIPTGSIVISNIWYIITLARMIPLLLLLLNFFFFVQKGKCCTTHVSIRTRSNSTLIGSWARTRNGIHGTCALGLGDGAERSHVLSLSFLSYHLH
jgi:hypothetical protein